MYVYVYTVCMYVFGHQGFLHVFLRKLQANVIVVHLHAHQSQLRALESARLCTHVKALLDAGDDVVIMGDFNTLSPYDMRSIQNNYVSHYFLLTARAFC